MTDMGNTQYEYQAVRGKTVEDLRAVLEALSEEQWVPALYLGNGVALLRRPFTGTHPALDDEDIGAITLTDEEPEDPLTRSLMAKYGPHTWRKSE